jgi:hypothetical protein
VALSGQAVAVPRIALPEDLVAKPFTLADGVAAGLGRGRLAGHDLATPTSGVRSGVPLDETVQRAWAFALALPDDCAFSHLTAAEIYGLPLPASAAGGSLHVMRASHRTRVRRAGCRGHRGLDGRTVVQARGLRVTDLADTWCDCAPLLGLDDLVVLGDQVARRLRSVVPLELAVARRNRPRAKQLMDAAVPLLRTRSWSPMETRARLAFVRAGLPEPLLNHDVLDAAGEWLVTGDFVWEEQKVIGEYQGEVHAGLNQREADNGRRLLVEDDGWRYLELFAADIFKPTHRATALTRLARLLGIDPGTLSLD